MLAEELAATLAAREPLDGSEYSFDDEDNVFDNAEHVALLPAAAHAVSAAAEPSPHSSFQHSVRPSSLSTATATTASTPSMLGDPHAALADVRAPAPAVSASAGVFAEQEEDNEWRDALDEQLDLAASVVKEERAAGVLPAADVRDEGGGSLALSAPAPAGAPASAAPVHNADLASPSASAPLLDSPRVSSREPAVASLLATAHGRGPAVVGSGVGGRVLRGARARGLAAAARQLSQDCMDDDGHVDMDGAGGSAIGGGGASNSAGTRRRVRVSVTPMVQRSRRRTAPASATVHNGQHDEHAHALHDPTPLPAAPTAADQPGTAMDTAPQLFDDHQHQTWGDNNNSAPNNSHHDDGDDDEYDDNDTADDVTGDETVPRRHTQRPHRTQPRRARHSLESSPGGSAGPGSPRTPRTYGSGSSGKSSRRSASLAALSSSGGGVGGAGGGPLRPTLYTAEGLPYRKRIAQMTEEEKQRVRESNRVMARRIRARQKAEREAKMARTQDLEASNATLRRTCKELKVALQAARHAIDAKCAGDGQYAQQLSAMLASELGPGGPELSSDTQQQHDEIDNAGLDKMDTNMDVGEETEDDDVLAQQAQQQRVTAAVATARIEDDTQVRQVTHNDNDDDNGDQDYRPHATEQPNRPHRTTTRRTAARARTRVSHPRPARSRASSTAVPMASQDVVTPSLGPAPIIGRESIVALASPPPTAVWPVESSCVLATAASTPMARQVFTSAVASAPIVPMLPAASPAAALAHGHKIHDPHHLFSLQQQQQQQHHQQQQLQQHHHHQQHHHPASWQTAMRAISPTTALYPSGATTGPTHHIAPGTTPALTYGPPSAPTAPSLHMGSAVPPSSVSTTMYNNPMHPGAQLLSQPFNSSLNPSTFPPDPAGSYCAPYLSAPRLSPPIFPGGHFLAPLLSSSSSAYSHHLQHAPLPHASNAASIVSSLPLTSFGGGGFAGGWSASHTTTDAVSSFPARHGHSFPATFPLSYTTAISSATHPPWPQAVPARIHMYDPLRGAVLSAGPHTMHVPQPVSTTMMMTTPTPTSAPMAAPGVDLDPTLFGEVGGGGGGGALHQYSADDALVGLLFGEGPREPPCD